MSQSNIAFIGVGAMGKPMASLLAGAGHTLTLYDVDQEACTSLALEIGASAAADLNKIGPGLDFVITMLPDGAKVRSVLVDGGIADRLAAGAICIDMSSSDPLGTRELGDILASRKIGFIDAPVSGGVRKAVDGTLAIMIGGDETVLEASRPILEVMGSSLFHAGPLGAGHAIKALNNYVSAAGLIASIEALRIGEAFGLEAERIVQILNASTGRNNTTENKLMQHVVPESFQSGFSLGLMEKDVRTAIALGPALGVDAAFGTQVHAYCKDAVDEIGPNADHTAVVDKPKN